MKNLVFRVDASSKIGGGHLSRAAIQAEALKKRGINCKIICKGEILNPNLPCDVIQIPEYFSLDEECNYLQQQSLSSTLCIFDIVGDHNLSCKYQVIKMVSSYKERLFKKVAFFDGVGVGSIYSDSIDTTSLDLLIRPYATAENITSSHMISGFEYYIYPSQYYNLENNNTYEDNYDSVLITFGRSDPNLLTEKVLSIFSTVNFFDFKIITVVIGDMFLRDRVLEIQNQYGSKIELNMNPPALDSLFKAHGVVVCGTGLTKYEACLFKNIRIICSGTESDYKLQENFQNLRLSYHIGPMLCKSIERLKTEFRKFIDDPLQLKETNFHVGNGLSLVCDRYEKLLT